METAGTVCCIDSSAAATTNKTYTIDIDGSIIPASATGDALRLQGNSFSVFDITIGKNNADAQLGGGTGRQFRPNHRRPKRVAEQLRQAGGRYRPIGDGR